MFAASVLPVTTAIGLAIDFGFVTQSKMQLNAAADAAALAAAKTAANAFNAGLSGYIALGVTAGTQWFSSQATTVLNTTGPTATVAVTQSGSIIQSAVTYQATVPIYFSSIFGVSTISVGGASSATIATNAYISVTFLLDNSSSMLVAATQSGATNLAALTQPAYQTMSIPAGLAGYRCAFACHWDAGGNDYYGIAKRSGIQLRFDVVQSAVTSAITTMNQLALIPSQFSVGIYTFGTPTSGTSPLTHIYPTVASAYTSADMTTSTDLSSGIDASSALRSPVGPDVANTDFPTAMVDLTKASTAAGDGSSPTSRKKALIIVTDGLADYGSRIIPTTEGPIDPANCTAMKNLGYNVYVLYTTFVQTPNINDVLLNNTALVPYLNGTASPAMATSLQSCASAPGNYAEASDPAAITAAMKLLLQSALGSGGRFTK